MRWILPLFLLLHVTWAQDEAQTLAKMSSPYLFELDKQSARHSLQPYLLEKPSIKRLWIIDGADGSLFFSYGFSSKEKLLNCSDREKLAQAPVFYEQEEIGTLFLCLKEKQDALSLSEEEIKWLNEHPVITVHNERAWAPFNFNRNGQPMGFSVDMIRLLAKKLGVKIEFVTGEWGELLPQAYQGELDVMMNIAKTEERMQHLLYVGDYARAVSSILTLDERNDITDIESLNGKTVSVIPGFFYERYLQERYPHIQQLKVNDSLEAIKAVYYGRADATLGKAPILSYLMRENLMTGMKFTADVQPDDPESENLYIAVRKDAPILQQVLKKALDAVSLHERSALISKWLGGDSQSKTLDNLTEKEREWLKKNAPIRLGSTDNWPPFDMLDQNGRHQGINADFMKKLSEIIGVKIEPVVNPLWEGVIEDGKKGKSYGITALPEAPDYQEHFLFTQTYANNPVVVITKSESRFRHLQDVKKVITVQGNDFSQELSAGQMKNIQYRDTTVGCFNAVLEGEADGYIGWLADAQYLLTQNAIVGLRPSINVTSSQSALKIGVSKEHSELRSILDKALERITPDERNKIISSWIGEGSLVTRVKLTDEELKWLQENPKLTFSETPWEPLVFTKEQEISGMIHDYLELFAAKTGLRFEYQPETSWPNVLKRYEAGELDFIPGIVNRDIDREQYHVSAPYLTFPLVIASPQETGFINSLDQLSGKKVAVGNGFSSMRLIQERYPTLKLVPVTDTEAGIRALSNGQADVYVGLAPVVSHWLRTSGVEGLKIAGISQEELSLAFTAHDPVLIQIINKAIQSVTPEEVGRIEKKYIDIEIEAKTDYSLLWKFGAGAVVILLGFVWWNRTMAREITQRKAAQQQLHHAMEELQETHQKISDSISYASLIQNALLPETQQMHDFFDDCFMIWQPKDVVGGDIYLYEKLRHDDEALLMVIDCTGHGVPGAFMTMLVKAVEREVVSGILTSEEDVHPAKILQVFNRTIRMLLKQENPEANSNAGFDGGILYFDKSRNLIRFAGAETPLFYFKKEEELQVIKGDRQGIGYRSSDPDFVFTEHALEMQMLEALFVTTDGYIDQNGGEKGFPFGKKRLKKILEKYRKRTFGELEKILLNELRKWQQEEERNDDVTVVGVKMHRTQESVAMNDFKTSDASQ